MRKVKYCALRATLTLSERKKSPTIFRSIHKRGFSGIVCKHVAPHMCIRGKFIGAMEPPTKKSIQGLFRITPDLDHKLSAFLLRKRYGNQTIRSSIRKTLDNWRCIPKIDGFAVIVFSHVGTTHVHWKEKFIRSKNGTAYEEIDTPNY